MDFNAVQKGQSVLEYLLAEIIELAVGCDYDNDHNELTAQCVDNAIKYDDELKLVFPNNN